MKRFGLLLSVSLTMLIVLLAGLSDTVTGSGGRSESQVLTDTIPAEIYSGNRMRYGILDVGQPSAFGPHICTDYGDPFSPTLDPDAQVFRETWRGDPNDRTYHYQINVPGDYPDDVVRVEIFDPDSINQPNNNGGNYTAQVIHTDIAVQNGEPAIETLSCSQNQKNPCLISTGEGNLGLDLDLVNLWWFARVDENRGAGTAPGNGACGEPSSYNVAYNTLTYYELFYYKQSSGGTIERVPLAFYYGQSGDMVTSRNGFPRDLSFSSYNHNTDIRWVTPGGQLAVDQSITVPTGCGSPNGGDYDPANCPGGSLAGPGNGFEVNLTQDVVDIITAEDGSVNLYLDITTLSGASENVYDIWAGPNDYVSTLPSAANERNVEMLNDLSSHDNLGIVTTALGEKLISSTYDNRIGIPLGYIGPEYAGQSVYVSLYDSDSGSTPPIHFYFDTIAQDDYQLTFSNPPNPDPDGETGRCQIGSCNHQFVDPPYRIDIPTLNDACTDPSDPNQTLVCTPFYGGRLVASYDGGLNDTYLWHMRLPETATGNPSQGCTAFPIAVENSVRTLTEAQFNAVLNGNFTYPTGSNQPQWDDFTEQPPAGTTDPLLGGSEGQVFVLNYGPYISQGFDWLKWNEFITGASSGNVLANSLIYPGNSYDYTNYGDFGTFPPGMPPFRGFAAYGNAADRQMHVGDPIARDTVSGGFGGLGVTAALNNHIDADRALRLPLWDFNSGNSGSGQYTASGFGIFRILGYSSNQWLLLELVGLDDSCGQPPAVINTVNLNGATVGQVNVSYPFTATVQPNSAGQPITYTWEATGQTTIIQTGGLMDTAAFTWPTPGEKTITLTADNDQGPPVVVTHTIRIGVPVGGAVIEGPESGIIGTNYTFTATTNPLSSTLPITYLWQTAGQPPITHTNGVTDTAVFNWSTPGEKTITLTANNVADEPVVVTHTIQINVPAISAAIEGPTTGFVQTSYTFTATTFPITTTQPITYIWEVDGQPPVIHTGGVMDTAVFNWSTPGEKTITLTVTNGFGLPIVVIFTIDIDARLWIPVMVKE